MEHIILHEITLNKPLEKYIDHTLLKADATEAQIRALCEEARQYGFASVCVNTCYVPLVAKLLSGTEVKVCCVVGFPLGAMATAAKAFETTAAVASGAEEVDMVINVGALKSGAHDQVRQDIAAVVAAAGDALVKVILETCLLTDEEKRVACLLSKEAGAHFVKTSTGFSTGGATASDVALMRQTVGPDMGVKASGGIRTLQDALTMIHAGASRVGVSSGVKIMAEVNDKS